MKPIIVKDLDISRSHERWSCLPTFTSEGSKDVAPPVGAGSGKLILAAFVCKKSVNLSAEGGGILECWANTDFRRSLDGLSEILCLQRYEGSLTVTLKIEPVDRAAKVDAAH
jgi:hypothetical protein